MPIIPVGFAQVNWRFSGVGLPNGAEVTCGVDHTGFVSATPSAVATVCADAWVETMIPMQVFSLSLVECYVKFGPNDVGGSGSDFRNTPGDRALGAVPPNTSVLVRKVTAGGGRRNRGRMYVPGAPETGVNDGGELLGGEFTAWSQTLALFFAELVAGNLEPVVLHSTGQSATPAPTPILSFEVQQRLATQRDRLR